MFALLYGRIEKINRRMLTALIILVEVRDQKSIV